MKYFFIAIILLVVLILFMLKNKNNDNNKIKKVIIIGATSGIGEELAKQYHKKGYIVGLTGRRLENLQKLKSELKNNVYISQIDVIKYDEAKEKLSNLIKEMKGLMF